MKKKTHPILLERSLVRTGKIRIEKIIYRSNGHRVVGFLLTPRKTPPKNGYPCIIYNRGGSLEFGAINSKQLQFMEVMANWGYIVIASQYSGNSGSEGKDECGGADLQDILVLRDVLQERPGADTSRIGMHGASRGGMMTYLALAQAKWLRAAVSVAGAADLVRTIKERPEMKARYQMLFGGSLTELKKRSAIYWTERFCKKTPLLLMHGTADWRVSPEDSLTLSSLCLKHQIPHRLVLFEGGDHQLNEFADERQRFTREWFDRFVKNKEHLPVLRPHGK